MKALKIMLVMMLMATAVGPIFDSCFAETRTLHTTLYITVKPVTPQVAGAPEGIRETLAGALSSSRHAQFARLDRTATGGGEIPCYTMMEKL